MNMVNIVSTFSIVALGGVVAGMFRHAFSKVTPLRQLVSTNVLGALLCGVVYQISQTMAIAVNIKTAIVMGLFGAFAAFSVFSLDLDKLFKKKSLVSALIDILLSMVIALIALGFGIFTSKYLLAFIG